MDEKGVDMMWSVVITTANNDGKVKHDELSFNSKIDCVRAMLSFQPKRGYKIISYNAIYNEDIFSIMKDVPEII